MKYYLAGRLGRVQLNFELNKQLHFTILDKPVENNLCIFVQF